MAPSPGCLLGPGLRLVSRRAATSPWKVRESREKRAGCCLGREASCGQAWTLTMLKCMQMMLLTQYTIAMWLFWNAVSEQKTPAGPASLPAQQPCPGPCAPWAATSCHQNTVVKAQLGISFELYTSLLSLSSIFICQSFQLCYHSAKINKQNPHFNWIGKLGEL